MQIVSEKGVGSGANKMSEVPCYRCLFDKVVSDGMCSPETCTMLDAWLTDDDFAWQKYVFGWKVRLELDFMAKNNPTVKVAET